MAGPGSLGFDPNHNKRMEMLLERLASPPWHQTWWGVTLIFTFTGLLAAVLAAVILGWWSLGAPS